MVAKYDTDLLVYSCLTLTYNKALLRHKLQILVTCLLESYQFLVSNI